MYSDSDEELRTARPEYILSRMLSTKSYIPINSALAEENQRARDDAERKTFKQIGKGQCGTVYALKCTDMVIKLPNAPAKEDELYRDARMHARVREAFQNAPSVDRIGLNIPRFCGWVAPASQPFWDDYGSRFDGQDVALPNYGLISDRIYPLPLPVCEAIVDTLLPESIKAQKSVFLNRTENKNCLIRLYLGRRDVDRSRMSPESIKLRNFPLHVDEMEHLRLDTETYARVMAQALAIMHWRAGIDANDVEFVLGSAPQLIDPPPSQELDDADKDTAAELFHVDFRRRSVGIWLLDFNQCNKFSHDSAGLKQILDGFWWNDPYYPRPNLDSVYDRHLWKTFAQYYLEASARLTNSSMPQKFIEAVTEEGKKRSKSSLFG